MLEIELYFCLLTFTAKSPSEANHLEVKGFSVDQMPVCQNLAVRFLFCGCQTWCKLLKILENKF